jgi:hypothetical protein
LAVKAFELSGQRGILLTGWGGLAQMDIPKTVHVIESATHDWLFPQMSAVVHHCGAGTTAAGVRTTELGGKVRREDGVGKAIKILEIHFTHIEPLAKISLATEKVSF